MYLYGASGHAKVVIDIAEALNIPIQGLFDDNEAISQLLNYSVYPSSSIQKNMEMIISIGNNEIRSRLAQKYQAKYINLIHPSAIASSRAMIGVESIVVKDIPDNVIAHGCPAKVFMREINNNKQSAVGKNVIGEGGINVSHYIHCTVLEKIVA